MGEKEVVEVVDENIKGCLGEEGEMERRKKGSSFCSPFHLTVL